MVAVDLDDLLDRVQRLIAEHRLFQAKRSLDDVLPQNGKNPRLLRELARIENMLGDDAAAIAHLTDAFRLDSSNTALALDCARALYKSRRFGEARSILLELPSELRRDPSVRTVLGDVYYALGWHAHAVAEYGDSTSPSLRAQISQLKSLSQLKNWFLAGGPLRPLWSRRWALECEIEDAWNMKSADRRATLDTLDLSPEQDIDGIEAELDNYLLRTLTAQRIVKVYERYEKLSGFWLGYFGLAWLFSIGLIYGCVLPVLRSEHASGPSIGDAVLLAALVAECSGFISISVHRTLKRSISGERSHVLWVWGLWASELIIGWITFLISLKYYPGWTWQFIASMLVLVTGITSFVWLGPFYSHSIDLAIIPRRYPRPFILDCLLDVLGEIVDLGKRNQLRVREQWISKLESAAWVMQRFFPLGRVGPDPATRGWIGERASDASTAFRMLACNIAAPEVGAWDRLMSDLRHDAMVIADGDFSSLRPEGGSFESSQRGWWHQHVVINLLRVIPVFIVLAGLAAAVVFLRDREVIKVIVTAAATAVVYAFIPVLFKPLLGRSEMGSNG